MKKLLALLLLSPLAYSEYVCDVIITKDGLQLQQQIKQRGCERGDILNLFVQNQTTMKVGRFDPERAELSDMLTLVSSKWCANVNAIILVRDSFGIARSLSCSLYGDKPRISR